ncbi:Eco57I restriction-modification methylase domain-containing protein [Tundrisphaera lichenicola]|uniref:Eco57I restriction-modification methylase domain-containing protein n=1 Tax=Tundrisphaera lichenicola TaxID=2029860 RepID=UPI003EBC6023
MLQSMFSFNQPSSWIPKERRGVVYTKPWVVELLLDLACYSSGANLVDAFAIEPAAGEGAFLRPMARRLLESCKRQGRPFADCVSSLMACEIDEGSAEVARVALLDDLLQEGVTPEVAAVLTLNWIKIGDYLFDSPRLPEADFVVGNPPYIRLEDIPDDRLALYREAFPTMRGRADLYVAFFEAALRQLKKGGVCAYICADRWMLNQYGADLRQLVTSGFNVETIIEMHNAEAFDSDVSAYPAISVIRREPQRQAIVARATTSLSSLDTKALAAYFHSQGNGRKLESPSPALSSAVVDRWFDGSDPWPCSSPKRLATLRRLEQEFPTLEDGEHTRVGIGVATGCDAVFITKDKNLVEPSRLLPLAMASDTLTGAFEWSGHYLVDPWGPKGLVDLAQFPRMDTYFRKHKDVLGKRHTAKKNPHGWFRTIDRVTHSLVSKPKLLIPDIKNVFNPVLDDGAAYPHHNLYFVCSDEWDLEILGGILLSVVGQFFIEAYGVRMRGGYLRFQAQYLRRIRVPHPRDIAKPQADSLIRAFRAKDRALASKVAMEIYGIDPQVFEA